MKKTTLLIASLVIIIVITVVAFSVKTISSSNNQRTTDKGEVIILPAVHSEDENIGPIQSPDDLLIAQELRHDNIQIFLLRGNAGISGKRYLTLDIALETKQAEVLETSDVNELKINNLSDLYIYINSGDIVRGGKQDRTIAFDVIIEPKAKNIALTSFCVESGRWSSRKNEVMSSFSSSKNTLSNKELKVAAKMEKSQHRVWDRVANYQDKAEEGVKAVAAELPDDITLKDATSPTSLELTLENKDLKKLKEQYKETLLKQITSKSKIIGMAVYINGELASVDVYNNQLLFDDLFNKLLEASIAEAISEKKNSATPFVSDNEIKALFSLTFNIKSTEKINNITEFITATAGRKLMFSTNDLSAGKWLHFNWLETVATKEEGRSSR